MEFFSLHLSTEEPRWSKFSNSKVIKKKLNPVLHFYQNLPSKGKKTTNFCLNITTSASHCGKGLPSFSSHLSSHWLTMTDSVLREQRKGLGGGEWNGGGEGRNSRGQAEGRGTSFPPAPQVTLIAGISLQPTSLKERGWLREEMGQRKANTLSYKLYCTCAKARWQKYFTRCFLYNITAKTSDL